MMDHRENDALGTTHENATICACSALAGGGLWLIAHLVRYYRGIV